MRHGLRVFSTMMALAAICAAGCSAERFAGGPGDDGPPGSAGSGGGGGGGNPTPDGGDGLQIQPASAKVAVGRKIHFSANEAVQWSLDDANDAGAITTGGIYTAAGQVGVFHVRATSTADSSRTAVADVTVSQPALELLAGALGGEGHADGRAGDARVSAPWGLAAGAGGTVWFADSGNGTIRQVALADGTVTTIAGVPGGPVGNTTLDGIGAAAHFNRPSGLAYDAASNTVYISDAGDHVIRALDVASGAVTTLAGTPGHQGSKNGDGATSSFSVPAGLALDGGWLYVADSANELIRRVHLPDGSVETVAGTAGATGAVDATGTAARFNQPTALAGDGHGTLYLADRGNHAVRVLALGVTPVDVKTLCGKLATLGHDDGDCGTTARLTLPASLALDGAGTLWVGTDETVRAISLGASPQLHTRAGAAGELGTVDAKGTAARFSDPNGLAFADGGLVVADYNGATLRRLGDADAVRTLAGQPAHAGDVHGAYGASRFFTPDGVVVDPHGAIFVADLGNHAIRTLSSGMSAMLAPLTQQNSATYPVSLMSDGDGEIYASIWGDHVLRAIATTGGSDSVLAGAVGQSGTMDGTGSGAQFHYPGDGVIDDTRHMYIADTWNHTIRRVALDGGAVTTLAGKPGEGAWADGTTTARFNRPRAVAYDGHGNLYVADSFNYVIRKIEIKSGQVSTFAGYVGQPGTDDGVGVAARFTWPIRLLMMGDGGLLVVDQLASTIRRVDTATAEVTTIVGVPNVGAVRPGPLPAMLNQPAGIALTPAGDLIISDSYENSLLLVRAPF